MTYYRNQKLYVKSADNQYDEKSPYGLIQFISNYEGGVIMQVKLFIYSELCEAHLIEDEPLSLTEEQLSRQFITESDYKIIMRDNKIKSILHFKHT